MAEEQAPRSLDEFPEEVREDVEGLAWLGYLEDSFDLFGHSFVVRTLKGDEELLAGLLTKDYESTMTQGKAFAWANVALSLVSVDGDEDFCPEIGPDRQANARARFNYCVQNWYWILANEIFNRLLILGNRQVNAARAVRDLSTRSQQIFSPSPDSSTDPGDSENPEILDLLEEDSTESNTPSSPTS
jgi:hypothetical protein